MSHAEVHRHTRTHRDTQRQTQTRTPRRWVPGPTLQTRVGFLQHFPRMGLPLGPLPAPRGEAQTPSSDLHGPSRGSRWELQEVRPRPSLSRR